MTRVVTPETILAETILAECATIEEAKAVARDMRQTAIAVGNKYGEEHPIARAFSDRYFDFVDAMACWAQKRAARPVSGVEKQQRRYRDDPLHQPRSDLRRQRPALRRD